MVLNPQLPNPGVQMHPETISATCLRLIQDLSQTSFLSDFYLVGGTALSLQLGHRTSIDLDFFTISEFNPLSWRGELQQLGEVSKLSIKPNNIVATINGVKVEFLYFAYPPKYPLVKWEGIEMLSPMDIGLFKILAILGRNRKKDIVDLFFIDKEIAPLDKVIEEFSHKYSDGDVNLLKQLELLFNDEEIEKSSAPMMLTDFDWAPAYADVKAKLTKAIRSHLRI
jgi:predicted nucleotidyltransferase component of viral defense system